MSMTGAWDPPPARRGARSEVGRGRAVCACPRAVTDRKCVCAVVCGVWTHGAGHGDARRCATENILFLFVLQYCRSNVRLFTKLYLLNQDYCADAVAIG